MNIFREVHVAMVTTLSCTPTLHPSVHVNYLVACIRSRLYTCIHVDIQIGKISQNTDIEAVKGIPVYMYSTNIHFIAF